MYICQCCGKEVYEEYGSGRFCSRSCSNKWVALHQSDEAKARKIEKGKRNLSPGVSNKLRVCVSCGIEFCSNRYDKCPKCRNFDYYESLKELDTYSTDYVECPYCGVSLHMVNSQHLRLHGKTMSDLFNDYGKDYNYVSATFSQNKSETGIRRYNLDHITGHPRGRLITVKI